MVVLIAAFVSKNAEPVSIDLFLYQASLPLAVLLLVALFIGVVLGFMFNIVALLSQKRKYYQLKNKKETLHGLSGVLNEPDK